MQLYNNYIALNWCSITQWPCVDCSNRWGTPGAAKQECLRKSCLKVIVCLKNQFRPKMKHCHHYLPTDSKHTSVWEINISYSLTISPQSSLHSTEFKTRDMIKITWGIALASSSYTSVFWLVSSFLVGITAGHSFHCLISVSSCVTGDWL